MTSRQLIVFTILSFFTFQAFSQKNERIGTEYNGIQKAKTEDGTISFVNKHDIVILPVDSISLNADTLLMRIKNSDMKPIDIQLITRMIEARKEPAERMKAIMDISKSFRQVDELFMKEYYLGLEAYFGKRKLTRLIKKKK
ncbi:MAG: hypothetical protein EP305_05910 [Bacteroidetes bacterium]|nr:MAG: hypothetical protein EP305_05910 [Bacteroidota bacterium]